MSKLIGSTILAVALMTAGAAVAASPAQIGDTAKGKTLVDAKGMTLYTFDKDTAGTSACNGPCAANWPPLMADAAAPAGDYAAIVRADGMKQVAYKGKPLYTFAKDAKAGDTTGDGFLNGAWHVAKP